MKKNILIIGIAILLVISFFIGYKFYKYYQVKNEKKVVELKTDEIEVFTDVNLKDLIKNINGKLIENKKIDTTKIGKKDIDFEYITNNNITVPYSITITIVDKTPPIIYQPSKYTVTLGSKKTDLEKSFFCGDNYDNNPKCELKGNYNLNEIGEYKVTFQGTDSSNNKTEHTFLLKVEEPSKKNSNDYTNKSKITKFEDIIKKYKTDHTKIGIDISHWQGDINFEKVKKSGVEFVYIRVGRGNGIEQDFVLDDKFDQNIKGFNKVGIPVGVYFYSNANSNKMAKKEAKWLLSKIKKYKVDLEVVYDWENWDEYQEFNLSFYNLTETYKAFQKTVEQEGYKSMLYSSKNYLENIWYPVNSNIWLAHYTEQTNYEGNYNVWQMCNNGRVEGIEDNEVDIDILYK